MATDNLLGSLELVGTVASVPVARAFVRGKLGKGHPALDDVTLLVSELTNERRAPLEFERRRPGEHHPAGIRSGHSGDREGHRFGLTSPRLP